MTDWIGEPFNGMVVIGRDDDEEAESMEIMTDNATNQTVTQAAPSIEWLYCFACQTSQLMVLVDHSYTWAIYRCPNCEAQRPVLR